MSISSFSKAAKHLYEVGYYNEALSLACCAISSLSSQKYPDEFDNKRYKQFLQDNFELISEKGMPGISCGSIKIKVNRDIKELKKDSNGYVDFTQIIYHVIRCGLIHNCMIDESIVFTEETLIGDYDEHFKIPKNIIFGLIESIEQNLQN